MTMTLESFALDWLVTRVRDDLLRMPTQNFIAEYCGFNEWDADVLKSTTYTGFGDDEDDIATMDWEFEVGMASLVIDVNGDTYGPVEFPEACDASLRVREALADE